MSKILVFVYGTLKREEPNHKVLVDTPGYQKFISSGSTCCQYPLVIGTKFNIPFLLNKPGEGKTLALNQAFD
ncbi:unnamed protein product [Caenorhabditis bovis]|uniref:Gamma-glutamylcyclotransferase family protein n=1 Tax=Caenorhabditis bovis TaxID=2654633 RepID=A0A8S1ER68_9PELO|nr:unnamed protein product [Caenorhabditis bovis]